MDQITKIVIVREAGDDASYTVQDQRGDLLGDSNTLEGAVKEACWLADCHYIETVEFLVSSIHENL